MMPDGQPDGQPDGPPVCNPASVLPANYRLIDKVATTLLTVTTTGGVTSGIADATAGGINMASENPYLYLDLKNGVKVDINDVQARTSTAWDIALKRSSPRLNGGDSGAGGRKSVPVPATTLAEVTAGPASGYIEDDFTTADCKIVTIPAGEPNSAFGFWYNYDQANNNRVIPKPEVHVIQRPDGSRTALRFVGYYDPTNPVRGAVYSLEWKQLPGAQ